MIVSADDSEILAHFQRVDPIVFQILQKQGLTQPRGPFPAEQYFQRLAEDIIGQQLSTTVAEVITQRFRRLFSEQPDIFVITPTLVLAIEDQHLRDIGASWAKVRYIKDLAEKTKTGEVNFATINDLDDEAVITHLTQVKGVGRWTAEMFLIFTLGRPDVFSPGDLGLRRAMEQLYALDEAVVLAEATQRAAAWAPYRSYASRALWRSLDEKN